MGIAIVYCSSCISLVSPQLLLLYCHFDALSVYTAQSYLILCMGN